MEPEKDLVWFILQHSPILQPWQRDVMSMIHDEMLYFVPQMQTKIMNEGWACATKDTLLVTENGFIRFDELYESQQRINVASGGELAIHPITAFHKEEMVSTIRIRTRRGFTIEGAEKHRLQLSDGSWEYLRNVICGQHVNLAYRTNVWPIEEQELNYAPAPLSSSLADIAIAASVSSSTVIRHLQGRVQSRSAATIDNSLTTLAYQPGRLGKVLSSRYSIQAPKTLNEELAWFLGYFIGDGNVTKSGIGLTTGDKELADRWYILLQPCSGYRLR